MIEYIFRGKLNGWLNRLTVRWN